MNVPHLFGRVAIAAGMIWAMVYDVDRACVNPTDWWPIWESVGLPAPNMEVCIAERNIRLFNLPDLGFAVNAGPGTIAQLTHHYLGYTPRPE